MASKNQPTSNKPKHGTAMSVAMGLDATDSEIIDQMRLMRKGREDGFEHVVCTISGFENDTRKLFQIPDVAKLCQRLVRIGFISDLTVSTGLDEKAALIGVEWGAFEVWLCAQGKMSDNVTVTKPLWQTFTTALYVANAEAELSLREPKTKI